MAQNLCPATDAGWTNHPLDRVTKITFPDEETLEYAYNEEGAVTKMTDVHGKITNYTYYNDGRLYQVILERPAVADRVFTYNYDAAGRLSQIDYPSSTNIVVKFSGPSAEPGWDEAGNLLHLRYLLSNSHLHRFAYTYDDSGNRVTMLDTPTTTGNAVLWEYGYDWLNRLISVSRGSTPMAVYTYDERDNRLSLEWPHLSETFNFTYDDANQLVNRKLATTIVETYDHDDDGNMIARAVVGGTTTTYRWSDSNRLLQRRVDGDTQDRFKYDAGGIRESKKGGPKYFSSGSVSVADMRPSNVPVSYFQGHQLLGMEVDGTFYYYLTDGLSNLRLVVNSTGTVVASSVYNEFGIPETDPEYTAGSADLRPHGYVGGLGVRNDWASSGLHLMGNRYYDPGLGRWLSQDPIGFSGGLNLYAYCYNQPLDHIDPSGLKSPYPKIPADVLAIIYPNGKYEYLTSDVKNAYQSHKFGVPENHKVPIFAPPLEPQYNNMQEFVRNFETKESYKTIGGFRQSWDFKSNHDWKLTDCRYDATGNFLYGFTGRAAGYDEGTLLLIANGLKFFQNDEHNKADIRAGAKAYDRMKAAGGRLGTAPFKTIRSTFPGVTPPPALEYKYH